MKRKFIKGFLIIICLFLIFGMVACQETTNEPSEGGSGNNENTNTEKSYTIAIYNNLGYQVFYYKENQKITLKAEEVTGKEFICWEENGEVISYEKSIEYTVKTDAVVKSVYSIRSDYVLLLEDGETIGEEKARVIFEENKVQESEFLYNDYHFILPIPTKENCYFLGWYFNEKQITDEKGKSLTPYSGEENVLRAKFKENEYVNIITINNETGESYNNKHYIKDGEFIYEAEKVTDRSFVQWKNSEGVIVSNEQMLILSMDGLTPGETYTYLSYYEEAYMLLVIGGYGSGGYKKEETISLSSTYPIGKNFLYWQIEGEDKEGNKITYALGKVTVGTRELLCLIDNQNDKYYYYDGAVNNGDGTYGAIITVDGIQDIEKLSNKEEITLLDLENIGVKIEGKETIIKAIFEGQGYVIEYKLNHVINGESLLTEEYEEELISMGFEKDGNLLIYKEEYLYNDVITLISLPEIDNYQFERWQNVTGEAIPTRMPNKKVELVGNFSVDKINVAVSSGNNGTVKIGASGNVTNGYYDYNSTIKFYVTAEEGYVQNGWENINGETVTLNCVQEKENNNVLTYVFEYKVLEKQTFIINFTPRKYRINYTLYVIYDGNDVTEKPEYFTTYTEEENVYEYKDGYNSYYEEYAYKTENCSLSEPLSAKKLGLKYSDYWTLSGWVVEGGAGSIGDISNFVMPKRDINVSLTYNINNYKISLSKQVGITSCSFTDINGKKGEELEDKYLTDEDFNIYTVPYGSDIKVEVICNTGCSIGELKNDDTVITESNAGYQCNQDEDDKYRYLTEFKMLIAKNLGVNYSFYGVNNHYSLEYYVNVDFDNYNPELDIKSYLTLNEEDVKMINGVEYYKLVSTQEDSGENVLTKDDYIYNETINKFFPTTSKISKLQYKFPNGWKMVYCESGEIYDGEKMPDENIFLYGEFLINKYKANIGKTNFEFDEETNPVNTADCVYFTQDEVETNFVDGTEYRYYSSLTLSPSMPTGYDLVEWEVTSGNVKTILPTTDVTIGEEQSVNDYVYEIDGDGNVIIKLTKSFTVTVKYKKKIFNIALADEYSSLISIKKPNSDEYFDDDDVKTFEYGAKINFYINDKLKTGETVSKVDIVLENETSETIEVDMENYKIVNRNFTTTKNYTSHISLIPTIEKIQYKINYVVYSAKDSINYLDTLDTNQRCTLDGYTVEYTSTVTLIGESEVKNRLSDKGVETDYVMFSGWYEEISNSAEEGAGFTQDGVYTSNKTYTHNTATADKTFYAYLINIFTYDEITGGYRINVNSNILNTKNYKRYFTENYTTVPIKEKYNDLDVVEIGTFGGLTGLVELDLPSTVVSISRKAFMGCTNLTNFSWSENTETVGASAFEGCVNLSTDVTTNIPNSVTTIEERAFYGCTNLTTVNIHSGITTIGTRAFAEISKLIEINYDSKITSNNGTVGASVFEKSGSESDGINFNVGENVKEIVANLFRADVSGQENAGLYLKKVTICDSDTEIAIGSNAFNNTALQEIELNDRITAIYGSAFANCVNLETVDLSNTAITTVYENVFAYSGVKEVILPSTVTEIYNFAFRSCGNLNSIYYTEDGNGEVKLTSIKEGVFRDDKSKTAIVRFTNVNNKAEVDADATKHRVIDIPNGVTNLGVNVFRNCINVEEITIGSDVSTVGSYAFNGLTSLKKVNFNATAMSNLSVGDEIFASSGIDSGVDVVISDSVKNIPAYLFHNFSTLKVLTIPENVENIGARAFIGTSNLTTINYNAIAVEDLDESPFDTNSGWEYGTSLIIGENVERIPNYMFASIKNLNSVVFNQGEDAVLEIGQRAFSRVVADIEIPILSELTIKQGAFDNATSSRIEIKDGTPNITLEIGALSTINDEEPTTISILGKEMVGLVASITEGSLVIVKNENGGYDTTIYGEITAQKDFNVEENENLILAQGSTFTNEKNMIVYGDIELETGETVENNGKITGNGNITGAVKGEVAMTRKSAQEFYNKLLLYGEFEINAETSIEKDVEIAQDATITINEKVSLVSDTLTLNGKVVVNNEFNVQIGVNGGDGEIEISNGANSRFIYNGKEYVDNVDKQGFVLEEGVMTITLSTFVITIKEGATAELVSDLELDINQKVVNAGALTVSARNVFYSAEIGGTVVVIDVLVLDGYTVTGEIKADAKQSTESKMAYYGAIADAISEQKIENVKIEVMRNVSSENVITIEKEIEIDLGGFTFTSYVDADDGADDGAKNGFNVTEAGILTLSNGTFNAPNAENAIYSEVENALTLSAVNVIGKTKGVYSLGAVTITNGSISADTAIKSPNNITLNGVGITSRVGIEVDTTSTTKVTLTLGETTVNATETGIIINGVETELIITGGEITAEESAINIIQETNNTTVTINGASIKGTNNAIYVKGNATVGINNSTISANKERVSDVNDIYGTIYIADFETTKSDWTFEGTTTLTNANALGDVLTYDGRLKDASVVLETKEIIDFDKVRTMGTLIEIIETGSYENTKDKIQGEKIAGQYIYGITNGYVSEMVSLSDVTEKAKATSQDKKLYIVSDDETIVEITEGLTSDNKIIGVRAKRIRIGKEGESITVSGTISGKVEVSFIGTVEIDGTLKNEKSITIEEGAHVSILETATIGSLQIINKGTMSIGKTIGIVNLVNETTGTLTLSVNEGSSSSTWENKGVITINEGITVELLSLVSGNGSTMEINGTLQIDSASFDVAGTIRVGTNGKIKSSEEIKLQSVTLTNGAELISDGEIIMPDLNFISVGDNAKVVMLENSTFTCGEGYYRITLGSDAIVIDLSTAQKIGNTGEVIVNGEENGAIFIRKTDGAVLKNTAEEVIDVVSFDVTDEENNVIGKAKMAQAHLCDMVTKKATCTETGLIYCANRVEIVVEGEVINLYHKDVEEVLPMVDHKYVNKLDNTHSCSVCGKTLAHSHTATAGEYAYFTVNDKNMLGYRCNGCRGAEYIVLDGEQTEADAINQFSQDFYVNYAPGVIDTYQAYVKTVGNGADVALKESSAFIDNTQTTIIVNGEEKTCGVIKLTFAYKIDSEEYIVGTGTQEFYVFVIL